MTEKSEQEEEWTESYIADWKKGKKLMEKELKEKKKNDMKKEIKCGFKEVFYVGLIGIFSVIAGDIFRDRFLRIVGIVFLAIVFVINSRMLLKRIERLERNVKKS